MYSCIRANLELYLIHHLAHLLAVSFFFFNDTATTEIYTLSLHDALPISQRLQKENLVFPEAGHINVDELDDAEHAVRSEEHTSELQSRLHLVCRLLLEKKKKVRSLELLLAAFFSYYWS